MERLETSKVKSFIPFCYTFFLFFPENKIYMMRIKKQNVLYVEDMSFKCLLDVPFWIVLARDVFRSLIKSLRWSIFCEDS